MAHDEKPAQGLQVFTVGHSAHSVEQFLALLHVHGVQALVDTRSAPYSRHAPQFDRETLKAVVNGAALRYVWMGDAVGGRPRYENCYDSEGRVLYGRVAETDEFREGLARIERGASEFRLALLCSEEDPAHCHRRLLITRVLLARGATVAHIRGDGSLETDAQVAERSGKELVNSQPALFRDIEETRWRSTGVIGKRAARSVMG